MFPQETGKKSQQQQLFKLDLYRFNIQGRFGKKILILTLSSRWSTAQMAFFWLQVLLQQVYYYGLVPFIWPNIPLMWYRRRVVVLSVWWNHTINKAARKQNKKRRARF